MKKNNKLDFKDLLRKNISNKHITKRRYFSRADLRDFDFDIRPDTLNRYLVSFKQEGVLYSAGRGWYSFVKQPIKLDFKPVNKLIDVMKEKYSLLSFSVWSTEQVKSFAHHMLTRFVTFIYAERDAMPGIYDFLKDSGYDVWLNPRGNDAKKFRIGVKSIVIRPAISREGSTSHRADLEKILIDLLIESSALNLMDADEHTEIIRNMLAAGRVDIGKMLNYAKRRKINITEMTKIIKSI